MRCPNCGSSETKIEKGYFSSNPYEGYSYLSSIVKTKEDLIKFRDGQSEIVCNNCGIVFLSPWLSIRERNEIYNKVKRVHNSGWVSLENSIIGSSRLDIQHVAYTLLNRAIDKLKLRGLDVTNYAELNCPFSGPRLFAFSQSSSFKERITAFKNSAIKGNKTSFSSSIEEFFLLLNIFIFRILLVVKRIYINTSVKKVKIHDFFTDSDLIVASSSCFWSGNCVRFNNTCTGISNSLLFKEVVHLGAARKRYDLIFASNVLDHVDNPSSIVEMLMGLSRALVIQVHTRRSIGYQHLYAFNSGFFSRLESQFDVVDLGIIDSANGYSEQGYLLIKRE